MSLRPALNYGLDLDSANRHPPVPQLPALQGEGGLLDELEFAETEEVEKILGGSSPALSVYHSRDIRMSSTSVGDGFATNTSRRVDKPPPYCLVENTFDTGNNEYDTDEDMPLVNLSLDGRRDSDVSMASVGSLSDSIVSESQVSLFDAMEVDTSIDTIVVEDVKPSRMGSFSDDGVQSMEECIDRVLEAVATLRRRRNSQILCSPHQSPISYKTSHVRSSSLVSRYSHPSARRHPYHTNARVSWPFYWRGPRSGRVSYIALPSNLTHLHDAGNQWGYSLTGPWGSRGSCLVGDIHFSPSETSGFDYWVYNVVDEEGVWCLCTLAATHPLTNELVLQHRTINSPPQWVRSWPGLDSTSMYCD